MTFLNESLVNQITLQSEDISRQLIELNHRNESRIQEIKQATLSMVMLHRSQLLAGPSSSTYSSDDNLSVVDQIDQVIQESSHLIHALQESAMDSHFSVTRLKHQVVQINRLLNSLRI